MPGEPLFLADLRDHHSGQTVFQPRQRARAAAFDLPVARDGFGVVKTLDGIIEVAHESAAPKLAVSENPEPEILLALQYALNLAVFDLLQLFRSDGWILAR